MAAVPLFRDTNMAAVTSQQNTINKYTPKISRGKTLPHLGVSLIIYRS